MSVSYWGLDGYGIRIDSMEMFDALKLSSLVLDKEELVEFEARIKNLNHLSNSAMLEILDSMLPESLSEYTFRKITNSSRYICFATTGNNNDGEYLYYPSKLPWAMSDEEKSFTRLDVEDEIISLIRPYLLNNSIEAENKIRQEFDYINTGGEG